VANAIGLVFGALLTAVFAAIALVVVSNSLIAAGLSIDTGLWSLLPLLFPFTVVAVILIGIYSFFRAYAGD